MSAIVTSQAADRRADAAAVALGSTWELWATAGPHGWFRRRDGVFAAVTGIPLAGFNGVWTERKDFDDQALDELLDDVAVVGLPYCLQVRPAASERLATVATARAMTLDEKVPLMVLRDATRLDDAQQVDGLAIRQLEPEEVSVHNDLSARGFGAPLELLEQVVTPQMLRTDGTRFYIGESDGVPVTTGSGSTIGDAVGIFNIATPEEHRGRGYGAAVTARAVADGLAAGAEWSYLQSSEAGYRVYQSLGFDTVEVWDCWVMSRQ